MAKKKHASGATPAVTAATRAGVPFVTHAYDHDPAADSYGQEAAEALAVSPAQVFKTLVADVGEELVVAVVPVATSLDLKALAAAVGAKRAAMAEPQTAERTTGYVLGGISPLGQRRALRTVLDATAEEHESVYVSAGRRGLEIELTPDDLTTLTSATVAPIARS